MLMVAPCPAAFPCGRKQSELLYRGRSLRNQSEQLDAIVEPAQNFTEDQLTTLNATQPEHAGNRTAEPRVVGGYLEKQGGSPWQVSPRRPAPSPKVKENHLCVCVCVFRCCCAGLMVMVSVEGR